MHDKTSLLSSFKYMRVCMHHICALRGVFDKDVARPVRPWQYLGQHQRVFVPELSAI